ncbi:unnamed protein product [Candidula unifasciata]|uniref:C2H2-type domain-containing protein n=1 Tax=Candidula unifasciata TaxID=100452 RepID=A0A8S3Z3U6_9EUPU|nr:unnamed protein product [Candidula unifasciata]
MDHNQLANPFVSATVVVADQFVDTFPHPQGLLAYLHRLCQQLDVDIVSQERPIVVKGSWKTLIKIDAFLKSLVSRLHNVMLKGDVFTQDDFNAAFSQFEEEGSCRNELTDNKHTSKDVLLSSELSELKTDDYLDIIKTDHGMYDPSIIMDKWYFNSNLRGKTIDKRTRNADSGMQPPEPYILVETDDTSKTNKANLTEIEQVLSQVYRKETIEKYQKRSAASGSGKHLSPSDFSFDFTKEEIVHIDVHDRHNSEQQFTDVESKPQTLIDNTTSNSQTFVRNSISNKELKRLEINSNYLEKDVNIDDINEQTNYDKDSRPVRLRLNRHRLNRHKTVEIVDNDVTVLKRHSKYRRSGRKRKKCKGSNEDVKQVTNCKTLIKNDRIREVLLVQTRSVSRCDKKASSEINSQQVSTKDKRHTESDCHKINKKAAIKNCQLADGVQNETVNNFVSVSEVQVKSKTSLQISNQEENVNEVTKNNVKKEVEDDQHSCDQCSYSTIKHVQLLEHKRRVHLTRKFQCEECLKEFGFLKDLRRHMKCHTKAENCCDICGKMYKEVRKLIEHKRTHAVGYVKPEFACKFCTKIFSTKYVLAYHIKADHLGMKRSYICPTCGKSFSQKNSYHQHANVHLGIRPFSCEICGKRFSYEKSLKEHKFMHNDEKVFSCSFCEKSFRQASGLAIHQKVHKTTKDYVCSMCGKGFNQKQALVRHERIHAGDKPYECVLCRRTFADSSVLRRHMILIHKKDPKLWREDTKCYVPKRTDFFISVLNGDVSCENNSQFQNNGDIPSVNNAQCQLKRDISSADNSQFHLNRDISSADTFQCQLKRDFLSTENAQCQHKRVFSSADDSGKINEDISRAEGSRLNSSELCGNTDFLEIQKQQQNEFYQQKKHQKQFQRQHLEGAVETSGSLPVTYNSTIKNTFPVYDVYDQRERGVNAPSGCLDSSCAEMKQYDDYDSENIVASEEIVNSTGTAEPHLRFQNQMYSPVPVQMHGSVPTSPVPLHMSAIRPASVHQVRQEANQHHVSLAAHHVQTLPNPGGTAAASLVSYSRQVTSCLPPLGQVATSSCVPNPVQMTTSLCHSGQVTTFVPHSGQDTASSFVTFSGQNPTLSHAPLSGQVTSSSLEQATSSSFVPLLGQASVSVPGIYQQSQFSRETGAVVMSPAQCSTMTPQSYAQTIVIFQDSLGRYQRPGVNFALSGNNTVEAANLQYINPSLSITSAPSAQMSAVSQTVSSLSSEQMYDQVLSTSHPLPH